MERILKHCIQPKSRPRILTLHGASSKAQGFWRLAYNGVRIDISYVPDAAEQKRIIQQLIAMEVKPEQTN